MNNKEIRTKYIKSLVSDTNDLATILKESTQESLSSLLDESVNRNMRKMIAESFDNSYEEEEVDPNESEFDENPEENDVDNNINTEEEGETETFEQPEEGLENVRNISFDEQQAGYLTGLIAGKMTKTNIVSCIGGFDIPSLSPFFEGYEEGAKEVNPDIKVLKQYINSFTDAAKGKAVRNSAKWLSRLPHRWVVDKRA